MLLSALLGPLPGCGGDSAPPAPPPELALAVVPSQAWCCPGSSAPAPCPLVALELSDIGENGLSTTRLVSSLEATMTDQLTGLIVSFAPPGRCVNVSGACGHLAVSVADSTGAPLLNAAQEPIFPQGYVQRFGAGEFEFLVGDSPVGGRRVRVEARDDADQPLLDPSGAPLAVELSLEVRVVRQPQADAPAPTVDEACAQPSGLGCRAKKRPAWGRAAQGVPWCGPEPRKKTGTLNPFFVGGKACRLVNFYTWARDEKNARQAFVSRAR